MDEQYGKKRSLSGRAQLDLASRARHLERAENAELQSFS
jgi:hypothetical protein